MITHAGIINMNNPKEEFTAVLPAALWRCWQALRCDVNHKRCLTGTCLHATTSHTYENVQNMITGLCLTSNPGCDPAGWRWADPRRWLVHTRDPTSRPRRPQTAHTHTHTHRVTQLFESIMHLKPAYTTKVKAECVWLLVFKWLKLAPMWWSWCGEAQYTGGHCAQI